MQLLYRRCCSCKQLTEIRDWLGTTKIETDVLGRATKITDFDGNEVGYTWNSLGQREKLTYPDGSEVNYTYNASGKLMSVKSGADVASYAYDPMGRISERVLPDSTLTKYEFNALGALIGLTHSKGGDILDQFKYTYDPVGNITQIDKHRVGIEADNGLFQYAYDPLNRLIEATNGQSSKQYGYDSLGNRVSSLQNGIQTNHSFNARNQLTKTLEGDDVTEYSYDKRGNLTNATQNGQLKATYTFDATNMMTGAFVQGNGTAEYAYNGFRSRISKLENFQYETAANLPDPVKEVRYVLDLTLPYNNLLMTKGEQSQSFVWGTNLLSANTANDTPKTSSFHYLHDHLGSPIRLLGTDNNDTTLAYDEFGVPDVTGNTQAFHNPFSFTGYQTDSISGLYYAQARYYDPIAGRFGAEDLIKDQFNWYGYCNGNPINQVDPDGRSSVPPNLVENWFYGGANQHPLQPLYDVWNHYITGLSNLMQPSAQPAAQPAPVSVIQDGNDITIRAYFNFTTNHANRNVSGHDITHKEAFLSGIEYHWSREFENYNVTTIVGVRADGIRVDVRPGQSAPSHVRLPLFGWSNDNRGRVVMRTGDARNSETSPHFTLDQFKWVAAHEFGHIMGLADARGLAPGEPHFSIMRDFKELLHENDIRMLLEAWRTGKWQTWGNLDNLLPNAPAFSLNILC